MKEYCLKVQANIVKAKACSDAVEKYEQLMDDFSIQKTKINEIMNAYDIISKKINYKEKECIKLKEELLYESELKKKYINECEEYF